MIEIVNGRVFVDGKETVDPTLIGYAVLDFAENPNVLSIKEKYLDYMQDKKFRKTQEREILIDLMEAKSITNPKDLVAEAKKIYISRGTCYSLFKFLQKAGISYSKQSLFNH